MILYFSTPRYSGCDIEPSGINPRAGFTVAAKRHPHKPPAPTRSITQFSFHGCSLLPGANLVTSSTLAVTFGFLWALRGISLIGSLAAGQHKKAGLSCHDSGDRRGLMPAIGGPVGRAAQSAHCVVSINLGLSLGVAFETKDFPNFQLGFKPPAIPETNAAMEQVIGFYTLAEKQGTSKESSIPR